MNQNEYIRLSLQLHLFFDRIMKEHSFFLEASFMEKDKELKRIAREFQNIFSSRLEEATILANGNITREFLESEEMITSHTLEAENKTSQLSGITIDSKITMQQSNLKNGKIDVNRELLNKIHALNEKTFAPLMNLIFFKEEMLNRVLSCDLYTTNYPLLITHITREAKMYLQLLRKVENQEPFTENYLYEQELFWNNIMKEHAEFIRGLLDPSEEELIQTAHHFKEEYDHILENSKNQMNSFHEESLKETLDFKNFKVAGEEGILNCKVKSIIIPLLADHVVREANHFIRILRNRT